MHNKNSNKEQYIANRKKIIALSQTARAMMAQGDAESVNEALLMMYEEGNKEITEFNTFWQWKDKGFTILKGVKAYLVWGQPRKASQIPEGAKEPEEYKYWPLCYLFANTQVIKPVKEVKQAEPEPEPEPVGVLADDSVF